MNEPVETSTLPKTLIPAKNMQVENKIPPTSPETPHRKSKGIDPKVALASAFTLLGACSSLGLAARNHIIRCKRFSRAFWFHEPSYFRSSNDDKLGFFSQI